MKTLIVVIHPDLKNSMINKRWIQELEKFPDQYRIHDLYGLYPDGKIDIENEQRLIEAHDKIIFQFPFYWFNCPPLFKQWLDEVLTRGWAYGKGSHYHLRNKKIALGITAGIDEIDYRATGRYKYTLQQLTTPFEITFQYVKADYRDFFAFYGSEYHATGERIAANAKEYISFIEGL